MVVMVGGIHPAQPTGIDSNRFCPGTLSFHDPAVADEAIVPNFAGLKRPVDGGNVVDNRFDWSFFRLLTPTLGFDVDSAWVHRNWGNALRSGSDVTSLGLKGLVYRNDLNAVEKFGIAVPVQGARLIGDAGGGLTLLPLPPVNDQDFVVTVVLDAPDTDDAHERFQLHSDGLVRKVNFQRFCRVSAGQQCREADGSDGDCRGALARFHP